MDCASTWRASSAITGFVLVLVAAGLLATAVHDLAEAGVITARQQPAVDLSWLITPGTIMPHSDWDVRLPACADRGGIARLVPLRGSDVHLRAVAAAAACRKSSPTRSARGSVLDEFAQRYRIAPVGAPVAIDVWCGAVIVAACGSGAPASGSPADVQTTLTDFAIDVSDSSLPAGANKLAITNAGAALHELEVFTLPAGVDAAASPDIEQCRGHRQRRDDSRR